MLSACRLALLILSVLVVGMYMAMHVASGTANEESRQTWLRMHPPRQAAHDAEMLRRRMLASLVELPPAQLGEHVPAITASLLHEDKHVRALALSMLNRLEGNAVSENSDEIAARLDDADDDEVRIAAVNALGRCNNDSVLLAHAPALVERLADVEPAVRWAAMDVLGHLADDSLATVTLRAVDKLLDHNNISIAKAAVMSWAPKLQKHKGLQQTQRRPLPKQEEV